MLFPLFDFVPSCLCTSLTSSVLTCHSYLLHPALFFLTLFFRLPSVKLSLENLKTISKLSPDIFLPLFPLIFLPITLQVSKKKKTKKSLLKSFRSLSGTLFHLPFLFFLDFSQGKSRSYTSKAPVNFTLPPPSELTTFSSSSAITLSSLPNSLSFSPDSNTLPSSNQDPIHAILLQNPLYLLTFLLFLYPLDNTLLQLFSTLSILPFLFYIPTCNPSVGVGVGCVISMNISSLELTASAKTPAVFTLVAGS